MAGRHWSTAKNNVTFHANKLSIRFPLVHLVIEYAAVVSRCSDVTALSIVAACLRRRFTRRHQKQEPHVALYDPLFHLCLLVALIPDARSKNAMTCMASARDNSAVLDQPARSRCSCSIDTRHSNPIAGAA